MMTLVTTANVSEVPHPAVVIAMPPMTTYVSWLDIVLIAMVILNLIYTFRLCLVVRGLRVEVEGKVDRLLAVTTETAEVVCHKSLLPPYPEVERRGGIDRRHATP